MNISLKYLKQAEPINFCLSLAIFSHIGKVLLMPSTQRTSRSEGDSSRIKKDKVRVSRKTLTSFFHRVCNKM